MKPRIIQIHDQHGQSAFKPSAGRRLKRLIGLVVVVVVVGVNGFGVVLVKPDEEFRGTNLMMNNLKSLIFTR